MNTLTKAEAMTADVFHVAQSCHATVTVGPRGGITVGRTEVYRRNGRTQTWKTRPNDFSIPVKYGLKQAFRITDFDHEDFHVGRPEDCPKGTLKAALEGAYEDRWRIANKMEPRPA